MHHFCNRTMSSLVSKRFSSINASSFTSLINSVRMFMNAAKVDSSIFITGLSRNYLVSTQSQHHVYSPIHISVARCHNDIEKSENPQKGKLEEVQKLVKDLNSDERTELLVGLQFYEADEVKKKAEEKLASWRWRSRFGRPSSIYPSNVDPTGTFCEISVDWLQKKAAEQSKPKPPTFTELRKLAWFNALPFVGFGFLDNCIMIFCGDRIDSTIGIYLGISTMAAAALGNTISDLAGIGSAWYVETLVTKFGIHSPPLSPGQLELSSSRIAANLGRSVGIVIGCLIGMFPLLFLSDHKKEEKTAEASQKTPKNDNE